MPLTVAVRLPDGRLAEADGDEPIAACLRRIHKARLSQKEPDPKDIAQASAWASQAALVIAPEAMDGAAFAIHLNKRHRDSLGGLASVGDFSRTSAALLAPWQAFHRRLHELRTDLQHVHESPW